MNGGRKSPIAIINKNNIPNKKKEKPREKEKKDGGLNNCSYEWK